MDILSLNISCGDNHLYTFILCRNCLNRFAYKLACVRAYARSRTAVVSTLATIRALFSIRVVT